MFRRIRVVGPAYLDRVLRVDRPLVDRSIGGPLDLSVEGDWSGPPIGQKLTLRDPAGAELDIQTPPGWPGGRAEIRLHRPMVPGASAFRRSVVGLFWQDDLGGMGAGFASALGGVLISVLGPKGEPIGQKIADHLAAEGIDHCPVHLPDQVSDWTLLVTSGAFGDKLPIGFRGCHAALESFGEEVREPCDVLVVASMTNRLAASALEGSKASAVRVFAPTLRNMLDRSPTLESFAGSIDLLVCNRREWELLENREAVAERLSILSVTDGPAGSWLRFRGAGNGFEELSMPGFPRFHPPIDTNRAGESYASTLLLSLLDAGWSAPDPIDPDLARQAAWRASAAAALVLDRKDFGFPTLMEIDAALQAGAVSR
ncbi:hypothetical protein BH23PLA1_BH23PLA1_04050 [soil metagenome]